MDAVLRSEPWDVRNRLTDLGLEEEPLRDVVRRGYLAYVSCTPNHSRLISGILAWGETVSALREYLLPLGWTRSDEKNYSVVVDPMGRMAIAVATGDGGTGLADVVPSTKAPKGPSTSEAVNVNQLELNLAIEPIPISAATPTDQDEARAVTWFLLLHRGASEVRCELSLPFSMGRDGHINGWRERIILDRKSVV